VAWLKWAFTERSPNIHRTYTKPSPMPHPMREPFRSQSQASYKPVVMALLAFLLHGTLAIHGSNLLIVNIRQQGINIIKFFTTSQVCLA